jgi:outer membrane protein OmpA-like peptidoglycan-associated protein
MTLDSSAHWGSGERTTFRRIDDTGFYNLSVGPKVTFRGKHFSPFFEFLVGDHRLTPDAFHDIDTLGFMPGGGLDIILSRHVALRLIRADYVYSNYRYGPKDTTAETHIRGARLQTGINFMFGGEDTIPPSAACTAEPTEVFAGETVTATAVGSNFNSKSALRYSWEGAQAKVTGNEASTRVNTTGLSAGPYTATANVSDDHRHSASCTSRFTVKQPLPPTISCAADPASVAVGGTSTITSNATSPSGRKLTYSYSASAGEVSVTASSATLNTAGAQPGQITVTCNAADDGTAPLSASSTTVVTVQAPPPPAPEIAQLEAKLALHSIYFQTARPTVDNPNGGLVESQEGILNKLAEDYVAYLKYKPDAHLILSGHADLRGSAEYNHALTERRVERARSFLVAHGVPADHIELRPLGQNEQLSSDDVKAQIAQNPDLTEADRQQMLKNLPVMVLANNRRLDISLSTTGQQSTHRYPFNAKDYLTLISTEGTGKKPSKKHAAKTRKIPRK